MTLFDFCKNATVAFFAYLMYLKIFKEPRILPLKRILLICGYTLLPALVLTLASSYVAEPLNTIIIISILSALTSIIGKSNYKQNSFYWGFSYVVSHILYFTSTVISGIIFVILLGVQEVSIWALILVSVIEAIFVFVIYKVKFKIAINYNKNVASAGTAISGIALIIYSVLREEIRLSNRQNILLFAGIILCGLGLYWWIKKESVTTHNEKLQEVKDFRHQAEMARLDTLRLELEKALHTENKKLPAYQEVLEQLVTHVDNRAVRQKSIDILKEFRASTMAEFSKELTWEAGRTELPSTGIALVDVIFDYYRGIAEKNGIDFELTIDGAFTGITEIITQTQLETLVSNLLDNAIIAIRKSGVADGRIASRLWSGGLSVEDNGAAFSESALMDLERCNKTLIPDEANGGGIGFVTIFEITNECAASVEIIEDNRIKSVTVRFDGENRFVTAQNKQKQE
jgi:signal transduction histidine kinase